MGPTATGRRLAAAALAGCLAAAAAGCGAGPSATSTPTPPPVAPATPVGTATPPPPTEVPAATASLPPFTCGGAIRRPGTVPLARISGFDVTNEAGVGRITFTFRPEGNVAAVPEVEIRPAEPPFTMDPSGLPLAVPGRGFVSIVLFGGTALDAEFNPTIDGPFDVDLAGGPIRSVRRAGDFDAVSTFVVGLDGSPCARVLPTDGTGRLVIELGVE
jgi:hypothetical protein